MSFGARALIRLGALRHNLKVLRSAAPGAKIMAVIKANAYGHGMLAVAKTLSSVDALAVARIPEAIELRGSGVNSPIIALSGALDESELRAAIDGNFELVVHCNEQLRMLEACEFGTVSVWLKFDTGMNRLGFPPEEADNLIKRLREARAVTDIHLMSHFSSADEVGGDITSAQLNQFQAVIEGYDDAVSIGNSAAVLGWPDVLELSNRKSGDHWIRPGIALFGVSPFADKTAADLGLQPVMQFEARLIAVKPLRKGALVGYKGSYRNESKTTLGIISAGYGDGYSRHFRTGTPVLLNGRRVPVIGNVSMDLIAVDLGVNPSDQVGDIATLWGDGLPVEEVARWADAIPYELVCGIMHREVSEVVD